MRVQEAVLWLAVAGLALCCSSVHAERLLPAPVLIGSSVGGSSLCLGLSPVTAQALKPGSTLQVHKCSAASSTQQWLYGRHTGYALKNNASGLCLAAERGKLVAGARLVQVRCNATRVALRWMFNHARTQLRPTRAPLLCMTAPSPANRSNAALLSPCEFKQELVPAAQKLASPLGLFTLFDQKPGPETPDEGALMIDSVFGFWGKMQAVIGFFKLFTPTKPDPTLEAVKGLSKLISGISGQLARINQQLGSINSRLGEIEGQLQQLATQGLFLALYPKTLCIRNMAEAISDLQPLPTDGSTPDPDLLSDYVEYANLIQGGTGINICDASAQENFYNMVQNLGQYMAGVDPTGGGGGGLVQQAFNSYAINIKNWFDCIAGGASGPNCADQNWSVDKTGAYSVWPIRYVITQQGKAMAMLAWSKAVLTMAGQRARFDVDGVYSLRMLRTLSDERSGLYDLYSNPNALPLNDDPRYYNDFTPGINLLRYNETSSFTMVSDTVFVDPGIIDAQPMVGVFLKGSAASKYPKYTPLYSGILTVYDRRVQGGSTEFLGYNGYVGLTFKDVIDTVGAANMVGGITYSCLDATSKVSGPFNVSNGGAGFEAYVGAPQNLPRCAQAGGKDQFTLYLWQDNRFGNGGNLDPVCPIYRFGIVNPTTGSYWTSGLTSFTSAISNLGAVASPQPDDAYLTLASAARDPARRDIIPLGSANGNLFYTSDGSPQTAGIHMYDVVQGVGQGSLVLTADAKGVTATTKLSDLKTFLGASFDFNFVSDTPETGEQVTIVPSANNTANGTKVYLDLQPGGAWVLSSTPVTFQVVVEDFKQVLQNNPFCYRPVGITLSKVGAGSLSTRVYLSLLDAPSSTPVRCPPSYSACNPPPNYP